MKQSFFKNTFYRSAAYWSNVSVSTIHQSVYCLHLLTHAGLLEGSWFLFATVREKEVGYRVWTGWQSTTMQVTITLREKKLYILIYDFSWGFKKNTNHLKILKISIASFHPQYLRFSISWERLCSCCQYF